MMITAVLAVAGALPRDLGQLIIVGKDCTAVAVAAKRLAREEAGAGDRRQVAGFFAFITGAKTLRRILYNRDAVFSGNGIDFIKICALPVQRDRNDRPGTRCDGRDRKSTRLNSSHV